MSGGSFNYLCYQDAEGLARARNSDLSSMRDKLQELGFEDMARKTQCVIERFDEIDEAAKELNEVWQAVEWCVSCDWGLKDVEAAVERHRFLHPIIA